MFRGPYDLLYASRPKVGQNMVGYTNLYVDTVEIQPDAAGQKGSGTMIVTLQSQGAFSIAGGGTNATYEIDWQEVRRHLEQHPRYNGGGGIFSGVSLKDGIEGDPFLSGAPVSLGAAWEDIKNASDVQARKKAWSYVPFGKATDMLKELSTKYSAGTTSYIIYAPVARLTTRTFTAPGASKCGIIGNPPNFPGLPPGYQWIKTADRSIRQSRNGKWERVQEWTGADIVDPDLYS